MVIEDELFFILFDEIHMRHGGDTWGGDANKKVIRPIIIIFYPFHPEADRKPIQCQLFSGVYEGICSALLSINRNLQTLK